MSRCVRLFAAAMTDRSRYVHGTDPEEQRRLSTRNGNDPYVGRRLVALLAAAGARPRRATWVFFGACAGEESFPGFIANLVANFRGARDAIAETGLVRAADVDRCVEDIEAFGKRPEAVLWYGMPWAEGIRPPDAPTSPAP